MYGSGIKLYLIIHMHNRSETLEIYVICNAMLSQSSKPQYSVMGGRINSTYNSVVIEGINLQQCTI